MEECRCSRVLQQDRPAGNQVAESATLDRCLRPVAVHCVTSDVLKVATVHVEKRPAVDIESNSRDVTKHTPLDRNIVCARLHLDAVCESCPLAIETAIEQLRAIAADQQTPTAGAPEASS